MAADKQEILKRIGYAWWMFRAAHDLLQLATPRDPDPIRNAVVRNALVESLAINGRLLIEFFCDQKDPIHPDNLRLTDLGPGIRLRSYTRELTAWKEQAGKHGAHPTPPEPTQHNWGDVGNVRQILHRYVEGMRRSVGRDMPPKWCGDEPTGCEGLSTLAQIAPSTYATAAWSAPSKGRAFTTPDNPWLRGLGGASPASTTASPAVKSPDQGDAGPGKKGDG